MHVSGTKSWGMGVNMDVNAIFDAVSRASRLLLLQDQYTQKFAQIKSCQNTRCGNCDHWMKSSCGPEKKRKEFKSCDSLGCKDFIFSYNSMCLIKEFTKELNKIKDKLNQLGQNAR